MVKCVRPASLWAIAFSLVILLAAAHPAAADPIPSITITSGSVTAFLSGHTDFDITGTRGFSLQTTTDSFSGVCDPCLVGESLTLSATISGSMDGVGSFEGQTYQFNLDSGGGDFEFQTPAFTLPETAGSTAQFMVPFTLIDSGPFASFVLFQPASGPEFRVNVRGSGTATLFTQVTHFPEQGTMYSPLRVQYDFATPTPEPASFFLVGTAVGMGWWHRRRKALNP